MGPIQTLDDFIGLVKRRHLVIAVVTVLGVIFAVLYSIGRPQVYESTAVIQVQSPVVVDPTSGSLVPSQSAQRLQSIEQQLTTRGNMLEVIARYNLFVGLPLTDEEKVYALRQTLRFERVTSAAATRPGISAPVSAFLITARADTGRKAAQVANDFAERIHNAGTEVQTGQARESVEFFSRQQVDLTAAIERQELALVAFKSENAALLPGQRVIQEQEIVRIGGEIRDLDQSLIASRNVRNAILRRGTERALDRSRLEDLDEEIETLLAQRSDLVERRKEVQTVLSQGPEIDRQIAEAERRLAQLGGQLDVATRRLAESSTAMEVEQRQQGETFALLEPAVEPEHPVGRSRRQLAAVGAVASMIAGIGLAFMLDLIRPVIRSSAQMERELDLTPLAVIPTLSEIRQTHKSSRKDPPPVAPPPGAPA